MRWRPGRVFCLVVIVVASLTKEKALSGSKLSPLSTVSATERTVAEVKKKWSDLKVEAKKRVTCHRQSMSATGGDRGKPEPTPLDSRIASILGTASGCGIVSEKEGDTDLAEPTDETGKVQFYLFIKYVNGLVKRQWTYAFCPQSL